MSLFVPAPRPTHTTTRGFPPLSWWTWPFRIQFLAYGGQLEPPGDAEASDPFVVDLELAHPSPPPPREGFPPVPCWLTGAPPLRQLCRT